MFNTRVHTVKTGVHSEGQIQEISRNMEVYKRIPGNNWQSIRGKKRIRAQFCKGNMQEISRNMEEYKIIPGNNWQ